LSARAWPPLIRAERVPWWVRARDFLLTLAAWALLAWWMEHAITLIWDWVSFPIFELTHHVAPDWGRIWTVLSPFFAIVALLAAWLLYWSAQRRRILAQRHDAAQPEPLALEVHAADFGLAASDVSALRDPRIATVRFTDDGRIVAGQSFGS
jgi:poly-beta-1,6-N-acetyl-D-glucosamine biosynthesis protein PgaD